MTIYDTIHDIVAKAMRGQQLTPADTARRADIDPATLRQWLDADAPDPALIPAIADALDLDADALAAYDEPWAEVALPVGIHRLEFPFGEDTVNAWRIDHGEPTLLIDAGAAADDLRDTVDSLADPSDLIITHNHPDHVAGIAAVRAQIGQLVAPESIHDARVIWPGDQLQIAGLEITAHDLQGHHPRALGYEFHGFAVPVIAVGDAVFARSAGGCQTSHACQSARETIRALLHDRPDDTLLLTGHGAATTLGIERRQNPFLARWLS